MSDGDEGERRKADWKDHVALAVALLETVLLPIVIVLLFMVALLLVLHFG